MEAESIILQLPDPLGTTVFVTDVQWFHHIHAPRYGLPDAHPELTIRVDEEIIQNPDEIWEDLVTGKYAYLKRFAAPIQNPPPADPSPAGWYIDIVRYETRNLTPSGWTRGYYKITGFMPAHQENYIDNTLTRHGSRWGLLHDPNNHRIYRAVRARFIYRIIGGRYL